MNFPHRCLDSGPIEKIISAVECGNSVVKFISSCVCLYNKTVVPAAIVVDIITDHETIYCRFPARLTQCNVCCLVMVVAGAAIHRTQS